jgi:parallel beta-helix repeat protein
MLRKTVSEMLLMLLLTSVLTLGLNIQLAKADGTITINADGSISPSAAPISTVDNVTYVLTGNIVNGSIVIQRDNIVLDGAGHTVQGTGVLNSVGIDLTGTKSVTVENTQIENFFDGIRVWFSSSSNINRNNITANSYDGIEVGQSSNNISIVGNNVTANNEDGIVLDSFSGNSSISGNNVTANNGYGIELYYSSNNSINGNKITNNTYGFRADFSSSNTISGNSITANSYEGIYLLDSSSNNTISGNNVTANSYEGIYLSSSSGNKIYRNNFINNSPQVFSYQSINVWDDGYPSGGNYWSDYIGTDLFSGPYQNVTGGDGIGDAPYVIDGNNTDHYPLFQPWARPTPTSTYITLSVSLVPVGTLVNCTATVSAGNATGTVTWSTSSSTGNFSTSVCGLSSGNCSTTYVDSSPGSVTIAACYSGDSNYLLSSATVTLTVISSGPVYYSKDYSSVQAAINNATRAANVIVAAGTYHECLVVNKTLTIVGEKDDPVFGGGGSGICITLLSGASGSIITGIVITNYDEGIVVVNASNCRVYGDIMNSIGDNGIVFEGSGATGNVVYDNVFQDTPIAINLTSSAGGNAVYCNIISSQANVSLTIGTNINSVYENIISGNSILLNMTNSMGNSLYRNDFLATAQIIAAGVNTWDSGYPSGGNYWSDYQTRYPTATEIDSSEIWNTAYVINGNNKDNYPLMKPYMLAVGHDVAVASVVTVKTVFMEGFTGNVTVDVFNKGEYTETFWVTAYATAVGTANPAVIGSQQVSNLNSTSQVALTFTWNTDGFAKGNYTVSACARAVQGETDVADNNFTGGPGTVTIPGDVDGNFRVDMTDVMVILSAFGSRLGRPRYIANSDIDNNGQIDMSDVMIALANFGQHYP